MAILVLEPQIALPIGIQKLTIWPNMNRTCLQQRNHRRSRVKSSLLTHRSFIILSAICFVAAVIVIEPIVSNSICVSACTARISKFCHMFSALLACGVPAYAVAVAAAVVPLSSSVFGHCVYIKFSLVVNSVWLCNFSHRHSHSSVARRNGMTLVNGCIVVCTIVILIFFLRVRLQCNL